MLNAGFFNTPAPLSAWDRGEKAGGCNGLMEDHKANQYYSFLNVAHMTLSVVLQLCSQRPRYSNTHGFFLRISTSMSQK